MWAQACERSAFTPRWNIRILYVANFAQAIYVLHGFEKRSRKTPARVLGLARDRYRALVRQRQVSSSEGG